MSHKPKMYRFVEEHSILSFVIYTCMMLVIITIWSHWIAPEFKKIPDNFSYSADILSLDNFYDEKTHKFEGEHISRTTFSNEVVSVTPTHLIIKNSFIVRRPNEKPIFSVSRLYYINPYNGRHVNVAGQEKRYGYLFAPQYASERPFHYWHVNYDAPALMNFIDKETINGLTVNHYGAHYEADQTTNLTHLPGVPEKRGVKTDIYLQLWIEPVSGWLIKYQDNTLAYYYDIDTGERLVPWNNFSNRYTQNSINEKVEQAEILKWKFLIIDFGIPFLLFILPLFIIFNFILVRQYQFVWLRVNTFYKSYERIIISSLLGVVLVGTSMTSAYYILWYEKQPSLYKIGISQWNDNTELLSAIQGFKDGLAAYGFQEGKNIQFITKSPKSSVLNQVNIIQSFIRDKVDVIFTLTTPGTLVAKGVTNKIPIVFTDVSYPIESGITHSDQVLQTNLVGTLNYISAAEQFFRFEVMYPGTKTLGFVHHVSDPDSEIQYQEFKETLNKRNIEVVDIPAIDFEDIKNQLQIQSQVHPFNALFVSCDTLMRDGGGKVAAEFSRMNKIPSFTCDRDSVTQGIMMGYFADLYVTGKLAGMKAALILRGANPDWLKTEPSEKGYLMINTSTAKWLGIALPNQSLGINYDIAE